MTIAHRTPAKRPTPARILTLAALIGLGASLAACGSPASPQPSSASTTSGTSSPSPSSSAEASPSASAAQSPTEASPSSAGTPLCPAASLTGSLDDAGGGAAGHIYMSLVLKNSSPATCILDGYPGVSMVKAGSTTPIGAPADRDPAAPSMGPITLAPGASASATLRYTQAGNYQDCQQVPADSILVYPPSATDSLEIAHPLTACSNADIKLLTIGAFQP
ncbi:DUF4232 domain-containing protein [Arthrobacter sp. LAPM80]|uniref:DUF4232 domain-containing protein n=1 Tax=Arthrobacter sp. LAPM80 TaxID=3141788 RepID=UPI00398A714D